MSKSIYQALLQERADLTKEQDALFALVEKDDREMTAEEKQRDDAIHARQQELAGEIERHERRREWQRSVPADAAGRVTDAHERIEDDPKHGFAHMGEFAAAVATEVKPNGRTDERLLIGAAPTNYHQETGSDEGRMVPPAFRNEVFEVVVSGDDSLINAVDSEPTASNAVNFLTDASTPWGATGVQAYWRTEAGQMTPSKLVTTENQVRLHDLYAFVTATDDLLVDAPRLADRLTRKSGLAIRYKINESIVNGTGAGQPMGWFTHTAKVSVAKESGQAADTVVAANIAKMYARLINPGQGIWYINQDVLPQLMIMTLGNQAIWFPPNSTIQNAPTGGYLLGRPVVPLENCQTVGDQGDIQFVNPKGYYAAKKGLAPEYAESMHLFFDYGLKAFRWTFRLGGQPYLSAAISPAKGSSTRAHVVVLDARA
jgi:HK97 family phage major capsid protein